MVMSKCHIITRAIFNVTHWNGGRSIGIFALRYEVPVPDPKIPAAPIRAGRAISERPIFWRMLLHAFTPDRHT